MSVMTVSRSLRGVGRVKDETRMRVREVAERLGGRRYDGVIMSRLLHDSARESRMRLVLPRIAPEEQGRDPTIDASLLRGLEQRLVERGGTLNTPCVESLDDLIDAYRKHRGHAVVLRRWLPRHWTRRLRDVAPVVYATMHDFQEGTDAVYVNEHRAATRIMEHLAELGHVDIGWVGVIDHHRPGVAPKGMIDANASHNIVDRQPDSAVRHAAWANFALCQLAAHKLPLIMVGRDWRYQSLDDVVREAVDQVVALRPQPTAIVCAASIIGRAMVRGLNRRGLTVPGDMSVVAYGIAEDQPDDLPTMTMIDLPMERIGRVIPELIERRLANPDAVAVSMQLDAGFCVGETTGPTPPRSREV